MVLHAVNIFIRSESGLLLLHQLQNEGTIHH